MSTRNRIKTLIFIVLLSAILPAMMFGEPRLVQGQTGGDAWRNFIFDFQTLIGGLFAVFAAWWTIDTMDRTDKSAQVRHEELVRLQLRADKLKVDRMFAHHFFELKLLFTALLQLKISHDDVIDPMSFRERREELDHLSRIAARISEISESGSWKRSEDLFGGDLYVSWSRLLDCADELRRSAKSARSFKAASETGWGQLTAEERSAAAAASAYSVKALPGVIAKTARILQEVLHGLAALRDVYGVRDR